MEITHDSSPIILDCKGPTSNGLDSYELCASTVKHTPNLLSQAMSTSASSYYYFAEWQFVGNLIDPARLSRDQRHGKKRNFGNQMNQNVIMGMRNKTNARQKHVQTHQFREERVRFLRTSLDHTFAAMTPQ